MFDGILTAITTETLVYYVLVLGVYIGLISWLSGRLSRSRADMRREERQEIGENLNLMEKMRRVRAEMSETETKTAEFDQMIKRLTKETTDRIQALNDEEEKFVADPAEKFLILPPPISAFGAMLSLIFGVAAFFAGAAFLFVLVAAANGDFKIVDDQRDLQFAAQVLGVASAAAALAFLARFGAYQAFKSRLHKLANRGDEPPRRRPRRLKDGPNEKEPRETRAQRKLRRAAEKAAKKKGEEEPEISDPSIDEPSQAVRKRDAGAATEPPTALKEPGFAERPQAAPTPPRDDPMASPSRARRETPLREAPPREAPTREAPAREAPPRDMSPPRETPPREPMFREPSAPPREALRPRRADADATPGDHAEQRAAHQRASGAVRPGPTTRPAAAPGRAPGQPEGQPPRQGPGQAPGQAPGGLVGPQGRPLERPAGAPPETPPEQPGGGSPFITQPRRPPPPPKPDDDG